ncbi:MAG TPA: DHH family phosphoesterase [Candidatus Coprosoma intestinipullorum]|uniref:DHH family phosphoesterase n=1 Tax=Candidatus Coprosoma intestinipullorum TaxID=2840752 RepID=A0A9D0ZST1_9FIRM|nr:DHH family phosphoesterase [Candidatus Coprosoma intestinipullorum]
MVINMEADLMDNERIKELSERLEENIDGASKVFIVGHNNPDYDAIGSALGIATIVKFLGKDAYIIINDGLSKLDLGVQNILAANSSYYNIITLEDFRKLVDDDSMLITTDVNKKYMVSVRDDLRSFKKVMIIDHHLDDEFTIDADYKYIDVAASSASEIVTRVLKKMNIDYSLKLANALLAGIILDTKRFQKNTSLSTFQATEELCQRGADYEAVNRLFVSDFKEATEINFLISGNEELSNTRIVAYPQLLGAPTVSFTVNRNKPSTMYNQVTLAKAADQMLNYNVDASFVLGYVSPDDVGISARSRGDFNVGEVLAKLQYLDLPQVELLAFNPSEIVKSGGGNKQNAGGRVTTTDIFKLEREIQRQVEEVLEVSNGPVSLVGDDNQLSKRSFKR